MNSQNFTWIQDNLPGNKILHSITSLETDENNIQNFIDGCVNKAVSLLAANINDDSLYFLFEWQPAICCLTISVTDSQKKRDSSQIVCCTMPALAESFNQSHTVDARNEFTLSLKYWLHDYLATCTTFLKYSLVTIFHSDSRAAAELL